MRNHNLGPGVISDDFLYPPSMLLQRQERGEVSAPKNIYKDFDCVVIFSDIETRINRLLKRGMDHEDILNRISNQKADDWWKSLGTVVLNKDLNELQIELDKLLDYKS